MILCVLSGVISMFVDNVVVILMMASVALPLARALKLPVTPVVLMIGFSANFMGTALLLGDLPPQMMHTVSGAEFMDFIWQHGRPSSFPILMVTFAITLGAMYAYGFRAHGRQAVDIEKLGIETHIPNRLFAGIVVGWFLLTVVGMAFRQVLGVKLGFIAMTGASHWCCCSSCSETARRHRTSRRCWAISTGARSSSTSGCSHWSVRSRRCTSSTSSRPR